MSVKTRTVTSLLVLAIVGGLFWYCEPWHVWIPAKTASNSTRSGEVIEIQTGGGQLVVSAFERLEHLERSTHFEVFGRRIPMTTKRSEVEVKATYRFFVQMEDRWPMRRDGDVWIVQVPTIRPTLPVAIDTATLKSRSGGGWMRVDGHADLQELLRDTTARLNKLGETAASSDPVRNQARRTIALYLRTWLQRRQLPGTTGKERLVVLLPGETLESRRAAQGDDL